MVGHSLSIHHLSLQRMNDYEIADFLNNAKQIKIGRSTITGIRHRLENSAARWYIELKQSQNKYIAAYKERIDSLLS